MATALPAFNTLAEAYVDSLRELLDSGREVPSVTDPLSAASNFGVGDRPSLELLGHGFTVHDPLSAVLDSPEWQPRLDYYFGLLAWTLAGSNEAAMLSYYHPRATEFSDDGAHLSGAFGHRLTHHEQGSQIAVLVERLRSDPASRRAIGLVLDPRDNFRASREYPCAASLQCFVRNGRLEAVVHMRAQQGLLVLPYDAFLFMALQAALAAELGIETGSYRHFAGTFHVYADELELARAVVNSDVQSRRLAPPKGGINDVAASLSAWEAKFRCAALADDEETVRELAARACETDADTMSGQGARVFMWKAARRVKIGDLERQAADVLQPFARLVSARRDAT